MPGHNLALRLEKRRESGPGRRAEQFSQHRGKPILYRHRPIPHSGKRIAQLFSKRETPDLGSYENTVPFGAKRLLT